MLFDVSGAQILYRFEFYSPENTRTAIRTRIGRINTRIFQF
jgi:hypothetical protein